MRTRSVLIGVFSVVLTLGVLYYWLLSACLDNVYMKLGKNNKLSQFSESLWIFQTNCLTNLPILDKEIAKSANNKNGDQTTVHQLPVDFDENTVVIYNRVPKTGSTSFVNLAYELCKKNKFHVLHINVTGNMHVLSLPNQLSFVRNVTSWSAIRPALFHGHMAFLDFSK